MPDTEKHLVGFFAYETIGTPLDLALESNQVKTAETRPEARERLKTCSHVWLKGDGPFYALLTAETLDALERGETVQAPIGEVRTTATSPG